MNQEIIHAKVTQIGVDISCRSEREKLFWGAYPDISIELRNWITGFCCGLNLNTNGKLFGKKLLLKHTSENCFFDGFNVIHPV